MIQRDLHWLAGLLEGEGWFGFSRSRHGCHYPRVTVVMTDEDVIRRAASLVGTGHVRPVARQQPHHKPSWSWSITDQHDAAALMLTLFSLMGERRQGRIHDVLHTWLTEVHPCTK